MTDSKLKALFIYHNKGGANRWVGEKQPPVKQFLLFPSRTRQRFVVSLVLMATLLNITIGLVPSRAAPVAASENPGVIAYVRRSTYDIHVISPDGTGDRVLWTAPQPLTTWSAFDLAWRPDGGELAFSSQHEEACSWYQSDIYAIRYDGTGYRRITNAPACAELAGLPKGSVTVYVTKLTDDFVQVYVQGASELQTVLSSGTLTFDDVADLGPGVPQPAIGINGLYRVFGSAPLPDVQPGETVAAGDLILAPYSGVRFFGTGKISWNADGSQLAYGLRSYSGISQLPAVPPYGSVGVDLPVVENASPGQVAWGPTAATKDQYLYYSMMDPIVDNIDGIYLNTVGDTSGGTKLVNINNSDAESVWDIEWLPDGSGFLFTAKYWDWDIFGFVTNIFEYTFDPPGLTKFPELGDDSARQLSISPDGQYVVFERAADEFDSTSSLWIMNRDGSGLHKLADDAGCPAWGPTPTLPALTLAGINPSSAISGGAGFTLAVNGTGFVSGAVVRWNGSDRATTYVNDTQLTASIPAADIATAGSASVTVFNPAPGGTSNAATFSINNPTPTITGLNPSSATVGGSAFSLTVSGTGFMSGAVVRWNGSDRATTYVNNTRLTANITAADIATAGSASVSVFNPAPGGGTSNAVTFMAGSFHYVYLPAILR